MATFKVSKLANRDITRIYQYGLREFGEAKADAYFNGLYDQFEKIVERPQMFASVSDVPEDYRRCIYGADAIYFEIIDENIHIVRVIGRQDLSGVF